jgi:octaprenyl-diphosphate synthase
MDLAQIYSPIKNELSAVRKRLKGIYDRDSATLSEILSYITESEGKLIRPALFLLASRTDGERTVALATSFELIHIASLLHDDVIDESNLRRARKTVNHRWGERWAVLVGDFLLATAFSIIVKNGDMKLINLFTKGSLLMAKGEMAEIETRNRWISEEKYLSIIYQKTAHFFELCSLSGAIVGKQHQEQLAEYGKNLGYAFQITDDLLDFELDNRRIGKPIGQDTKNKKITLPLIHALREADSAEKAKIMEMVKQESNEGLREMVERYGGIDYSKKLALFYAEKAKSELSLLSSSSHKDSLILLADFVVKRGY